jgi:bifunctional non-homologous end joining protein LigD
MLMKRDPNKVSMDWSTSKRKGKVFFDHNQNSQGKTIASVFSVRPTESATVSMPVEWKNLNDILPTDYTIINVPDLLKKKKEKKSDNNPWTNILTTQQDIAKLIRNVSQLS